jgi:hypothetical protein
MTREPANHFGGLVGPVVVQYKMDLTGVRGHGGIDSFHELKELVVAVPAVTLAEF